MFSPVNRNPTEQDARIGKIERLLQAYRRVQDEQGTVLQEVVERSSTPVEYTHQNNLRNGDFDWDRNRYLYLTDWTGTDQANVSEEAAHWYVHPKIVTVETTGSITAGTTALTIDTADFVAGDNGVKIIVEGAGTAGADLSTAINGAPGSTTTCTLFAAAGTTVTNARVLFRMIALTEDSTDVDADSNTATNNTLKTSSHTKYATTENNPRYNKQDGWAQWDDADYMLTCPLPYNTLVPSKQYILSFLYRLANAVDGNEEVFVDFYGGIYDNTTNRWRYLEGGVPDLTVTVNGTPGATTREYMVLMYMADGTTIATERVPETTTAATLNTTNYVTLSWDQEPGTIKSEIYRLTGGVYERIATPYPASSYYDQGATLNTVGGWPTADQTRFKAFTQATEANMSPARLKWQRGQMNITVPSDYDMSKTTGTQWFCFGFNTSLTGTDHEYALEVDLLSLDDKYGIFSKCPLDFQAKRNISTAATGGSQGTTGGGGGVIFPGTTGNCPVFTDMVTTDRGEIQAIDLVDGEGMYKIKNRVGDYVNYTAIVVPPQEVYTLVAGNFKITASGSHPVFTKDQPIVGKYLSRLTETDIIETVAGHEQVEAVIRHFKPRHTVRISLDGEEKGFYQNGVAVHNSKEILE